MSNSLKTSYKLTPREKEILMLYCRGYSLSGSASMLVVEKPTIERHLHEIYKKFPMFSTLEQMISAAIEMGIDVTPAEGVWSNSLTDAELETLELASRGLANKQIAKQRSISEASVNSYFSRIYNRLVLPCEDSMPYTYNNKHLAIGLYLKACREGLVKKVS